VGETFKANLIAEYTKKATSEYSKIITRYPVMDRVDDAKRRLTALNQPIPRPTKADVARNKAEDESRRDVGTYGRLSMVFRKSPDMSQAAKVGEPQLTDPTPIAANEVVRSTMLAGIGAPSAGGKSVGVEVVNSGAPAANDPAPRSDTPAANGSPFAQPTTAADPDELKPPAAAAGGDNELKPDPNELKPAVDPQPGEAPLPPPPQVNEIQSGSADGAPNASASASSSSEPASDKDVSSSKKKKKKGIKKLIPF
jgi:outer membrane protein assembly factor BamD